MSKKLISRIATDIKDRGNQLLFVENPDDFLIRRDVMAALTELDILIVEGPQIKQRLFYELRHSRYSGKTIVLLTEENFEYLEDMLAKGLQVEFRLDSYLYGYHLGSIINLDLLTLDKLFQQKKVKQLTREETISEIQVISKIERQAYKPDLEEIDIEVQNKIKGNTKAVS